ncbi:hypothetical protein HO173_005092 [Letharia columbiana]|uniref:Uncharacterized protein n=1 Tax=Letharia columbiana TaxID=112416 RepID=A0A8H6L5Z8_9LECA|nr:uncharacterized protein HO173_005092 [Letharia columbiana]KAF6236801.1 hypothetical protein HO173_005092 [Letharia columbiana]
MLQVALHSPSEPWAIGNDSLPRAHSDRQDPALPTDDRQQPDLGSHLVVSPYTTLQHLLDLRTLEESQRLLARALTVLQSVRGDYATAPYHQSFNWEAVMDRLKSLLELSQYQWKRQHFYIVVFRSQVPPTTDRTHLGALDQKSHMEATKSGGLLKYWFGLPDENGRNLATCIWRNFADARPASVGPGHKEAMRATVNMYTEWKLERLRFEIGDGAGAWSITPWED